MPAQDSTFLVPGFHLFGQPYHFAIIIGIADWLAEGRRRLWTKPLTRSLLITIGAMYFNTLARSFMDWRLSSGRRALGFFHDKHVLFRDPMTYLLVCPGQKRRITAERAIDFRRP